MVDPKYNRSRIKGLKRIRFYIRLILNWIIWNCGQLELSNGLLAEENTCPATSVYITDIQCPLLLLPFFIGLGKAIFIDAFPENCVPYHHVQLAELLEAQAHFPAGFT